MKNSYYRMEGRVHAVLDGEGAFRKGIELALTMHLPAYTDDCRMRTRITILTDDLCRIRDFTSEYQELFNNSFWRILDLSKECPLIETHRPRYEGSRKDFVDVEWEFLLGNLSSPLLQEKMRRWSADPSRQLRIYLCFDDKEKNQRLAEKMPHSLPSYVRIETCSPDPEAEKRELEELTCLAKYINYIYQVSFDTKHVPVELPQAEVENAWEGITDETSRMSSICNAMSIPVKMEILGRDHKGRNTFHPLTAEEIELLTEVEHNRWSVERLIQGSRPCTDLERHEIEEDMRRRLSDPDYARANPVSLKNIYRKERNAHFDLCAFSELGLDDTGLPVTRYDRELISAIPLIVKTFSDHHGNGKQPGR